MYAFSLRYDYDTMYSLVIDQKESCGLIHELDILKSLLDTFAKYPMEKEDAIITGIRVLRDWNTLPVRADKCFWQKLPQNVKKEYSDMELVENPGPFLLVCDEDKRSSRDHRQTYIQEIYHNGYHVFWVNFKDHRIIMDNVFHEKNTDKTAAELQGDVTLTAPKAIYATIPFNELNDLKEAVRNKKPVCFSSSFQKKYMYK